MEYLKQIYYEMRHQKMMTWVSISGTALAIFLVMVFYIKDNAITIEMKPESNRSRILVGKFYHLRSLKGGDSSASFNREFGKKIYEGLDGIERISYASSAGMTHEVGLSSEKTYTVDANRVDNEFWNICDFTFIDGRPFDEAEVADNVDVVVITRSVARKVFDEEKVAGREILVDMKPRKVVGVVEDVSPILRTAYGQIFTVFPKYEKNENIWGSIPYGGNTKVILLMDENAKLEDIKSQVQNRYKMMDEELKKENYEMVYHDSPYTAEALTMVHGSNSTPDVKGKHRKNMFIYCILILLPAINLSSMTRSRLRHRISEIGVRRAFGASKLKIISQLFGENFIITVLGGAIGLVLCFLFSTLISHLFFDFVDSFSGFGMARYEAVRPDFNMIFTWSTFFIALGICFVLNIVSATVPSWKAASVPPAIAINKVK